MHVGIYLNLALSGVRKVQCHKCFVQQMLKLDVVGWKCTQTRWNITRPRGAVKAAETNHTSPKRRGKKNNNTQAPIKSGETRRLITHLRFLLPLPARLQAIEVS